ncbi:MAG: methyltransferase domain-containing protein, partial [Anaerolineaceae bacterium]|nr:methyltransferase domain-containing protein [Anaerolineaceae bacterium]
PKDIGYILLVMGIGPGQVVLEAGTGSGALTCAFAYMVGDSGHVYSYDRRPEIQKIAKSNLDRLDLKNRVTFKSGDAIDGFSEKNLDALFLDLPNPQDYLSQVKVSLKPGGFFGTIVPTTNQVSSIIESLKKEKFAFIEICELLLRFYKADWERLRPTDRMVAHTGYLVFGRSIIDDESDTENNNLTAE